MKIMVAYRSIYHKNEPVHTYARSMVHELRSRGIDVIEVPKNRLKAPEAYHDMDLFLDIDSGRDTDGNLVWHGQEEPVPCPSVVYLIDSHGYPSMHRRIAKNYDHVFFAVWDKRDLFAKHPSAHWSPNFTDLKWFNGANYPDSSVSSFDFGFIGSKGGLGRSAPMSDIARRRGWTSLVREVARGEKQRWPATAETMAACKVLFNHGQKHDGPNLRVMESMAMNRPLVCDVDARSGLVDKRYLV
jgi:hypothetical protein